MTLTLSVQPDYKSFYVQLNPFYPKSNITIISPCTKAAADMLLRNDTKTILHDSKRGIRREAQPVKACMR